MNGSMLLTEYFLNSKYNAMKLLVNLLDQYHNKVACLKVTSLLLLRLLRIVFCSIIKTNFYDVFISYNIVNVINHLQRGENPCNISFTE